MLPDRKSQSPHRVSFLACLVSFVFLTACADSEPTRGPRTDESEDQASDGDGDDAEDQDDSEDDVVDTGKIDGGKTDAGKTDAGKLDAGKDAGKGDAGGAGDGSAPTQIDDLDAGPSSPDAAVVRDAATTNPKDASTSTQDASADARAPVVDAGTVLPPDPGKVAAADVITIGDSWMSNTLQLEGTGGGIYPSLRRASGQAYKNYAQQGVMLLMDSVRYGQAIPKQWDQAVRDNKNIKTVVMTAGGNDIIQDTELQQDCADGGETCKAKLAEIGMALKTLWSRMAAAGVKDIIHVAYAKVAGSGIKDADDNAKSLAELCAAVPSPTRCRIVTTDDLVAGRSGIAVDGIHPTQAANDRIATAIYKLMAAEHIAR
jgi:lysophospholipase L1-like esterase